MWIVDMIKMAANARPKNELVYNPSTYAEWTVYGAGTTKGAGGIHLVADGVIDKAVISAGLQTLTQYVLIYNVTATDLDNSFATVSGSIFTSALVLPKNIGSNIVLFTTPETIATNVLDLRCAAGNTDGEYIDFNSIRIFKCPAGSEIESDYTNLTAEQFNVKYPM